MKKKRSTRFDFSLILPTYHEEGHFVQSVRTIESVLSDVGFRWQIIFVDDASTDSTPELIRHELKIHKNWKALFHKKNMGRGRTVMDGIRASRATVAGYIDIDLEVSPVYIPQIVRIIMNDDADVVIGTRVYRTNIHSIIREIASVGYRYLSDKMVGTNKMDTESGYKFFNRKKILPVLTKTRHAHWFWDTEIMVFARAANLRIREVPVLFLRRIDKRSTVNLIPDTIDYMQSLFGLWRRLITKQGEVREN